MDVDSISRDFASFADPGTRVELEGRTITWTQERIVRTAVFSESDCDFPDLLIDGEHYDYAQFFASPTMGNLTALAETMEAVLPNEPAYVGANYVEGTATDQLLSRTTSTTELFGNLINPIRDAAKTQLVFIRGRAGDGKSAFLVHLSLKTAELYLQGAHGWLYLYVNAQGSSLARIDEVMAKVTQDLRARFTYHAIATLTRLGLIIPIIDGFDELLGVGGYKDAFSSLALFVSRLRGRGAVLASARSTFYQYTDFGRQAARFASDDNPLHFEIFPVTLNPWGYEQARVYLQRVNSKWSVDELESSLGDRSEEILSSPFLLSRVAEVGDAAERIGSERHLVRLIVEELIHREMLEKVLDPQGKPLLTMDQHIELLGALSEEMWWQEVRELDETTFITIAELVCDQFGLSDDIARRFLERVPSYALLSRLESPTRISFRHEFYFAFFLGRKLGRTVTSGNDVSDFLSRSTLSTVICDETAIEVLSTPSVKIQDIVNTLNGRRTNTATAQIVNSNAGAIFGSLIRQGVGSFHGATISSCYFNSIDFTDSSIASVLFTDCMITQCIFSGCNWCNITMDGCKIIECELDFESHLEITGLRSSGEVLGIHVRGDSDSKRDLYDQSEVVEALRGLGVSFKDEAPTPRPLSEDAKDLIAQLNIVCKVAERTLYFSEEDFAIRHNSLRGDLRPIVMLLQKYNLFSEATRQRRGTRRMYRLGAPPDEIRRGEAGEYSSGAIRDFWNELRSI